VTGAETAFFSKTYDEAYGLLVEARNYVAYEEVADRAHLDVFTRLRLSCETSRLTARITHIMSWLLFQKAVYAGELTREDLAKAEYRLGGESVCFDEGGIWSDKLPPRLLDLLDRSRRLYVRVARLDSLLTAD